MPALQPFWDARYTVANPGPYVGELYSSNPWDAAVIKGIKVPGLVSTSISRKRHVDVKQLPGASPIVTPIGYEPLRFTMSVRVWTPAQWEKLQPIIWFLLPIQQKTAAAAGANKSAKNVFDVYSPNIAAMQIAAALCVTVGPITGAQEKTLTIELLERRHGQTAVFTVTDAAVNAAYNAESLAQQSAQAQDGRVTVWTPTQGPQRKPSQSGITLTPTP